VAGDHLIFSAFESVVECQAAAGPDSVVAAVGALARAGVDLCRGQALEARMVGDPEAGVARYLDMVRLKTGALFRAVCQIGALLGGADFALARRLAAFGEHVGVAFQIRDDLLAYGPPERVTGKPATSDLTNGRPTLPVLLAYEAGTHAQRRALVAALNHGHTDGAGLARVRGLLDESAAPRRAHEQAVFHAGRGRAELSTLAPSPSVDVLAGIAHWASTWGP
jgi:geranylgeranyl diphosphate synthase type I